MRVHRQEVEREPVPEPWEAIAHRLEQDYPERWGRAAPRGVMRDPDLR